MMVSPDRRKEKISEQHVASVQESELNANSTGKVEEKSSSQKALISALDSPPVGGTNIQGHHQQSTCVCSKAAAVYNARGAELDRKHDLKGAEQNYREALSIDPECACAHNNLCTILRDRGDYEGAKAECRSALKIDPNYALAHNNLGTAFFDQATISLDQRLWDDALSEFETAAQLNPTTANVYDNLGLTLEKKGDLSRALEYLRRAHDLEPKNSRFNSDLERLNGLEQLKKKIYGQPVSEALNPMTTQLWIAFGFLALLVLFLMYSVMKPPTNASHATVKFLTALCAGFSGGFFTGGALISITGVAGSTKFAISGAAGMALFFTVWFFYPKVFSHTVAHETDSRKLQMTQELDTIRAEILYTRINNDLYPALNKLRKFFLAHPELLKIDANSAFYQKWLDDPTVEMGRPLVSSKWTVQTRTDLASDLELIHC